MPDLIPTLLFPSNIRAIHRCVFSLHFIETSHLYSNYQRLDFILANVLNLSLGAVEMKVMMIRIEMTMMMDDEYGGFLICDFVSYYELC